MRNISKQIIIAALILLSVSCTFAKPTKIEYLLPAGFTGGVIVLYNQSDGSKPEITADGTTRYRIPKDGFLKVNTDEPDAIYNYSFYYVDDKNNQTRIEYLLPHGAPVTAGVNQRSVDTVTEEERNNKVFAMNHRSIGFEAKGNKGPLYAFSIGLPKDDDHLYGRTLDKLDEINEQFSKKSP